MRSLDIRRPRMWRSRSTDLRSCSSLNNARLTGEYAPLRQSLQGPSMFAFGQPMVEDNSSEHQTSATVKAATVLREHDAGAANWARNAAGRVVNAASVPTYKHFFRNSAVRSPCQIGRSDIICRAALVETDRPRRSIESGEETVTGSVDFSAAEPRELAPHQAMMTVEQIVPAPFRRACNLSDSTSEPAFIPANAKSSVMRLAA